MQLQYSISTCMAMRIAIGNWLGGQYYSRVFIH